MVRVGNRPAARHVCLLVIGRPPSLGGADRTIGAFAGGERRRADGRATGAWSGSVARRAPHRRGGSP